jgi:hypothetical protein
MITLIHDDSHTTRYLQEILAHAGLAWRETTPANLTATDRLIVLSGATRLDAAARGRIDSLVRSGSALVVSGGTAGLDDLLGASASGRHEGYLANLDREHPVTAGLPEPLHVFESAALTATSGTALGQLLGPDNATRLGDSIVINRPGAGATAAIGADIAASVLHIQLGRAIHKDGEPAPDGTGPVNDGILKTDDGVVLSWDHDRVQTAPAEGVPDCLGRDLAYPNGDTPWFGRPVADELREVLLQAIAWAASATGQHLASLAEWPNGLDAVGLVSHDSDGNLDDGAITTLRLLDEAGINSTWCHIWGPNYPSQYDPATFPKIKTAGHEIALHYNSLTQDGGTWGRDHLATQAAYVRNEAGVDGFVSNKNHYLRWEGKVEFFHWLADEGIQADQCKGPSKKGNVGYPHGSSLPWFPLDPDTGEFIDVLEIPLQFQDLWLTTPYYPSATTIAEAKRHRGVAHFLFHQVHLHTKPEVAQAMLDVVADGRAAGLEWWTSAEINHWERRRRGVKVTLNGDRIVVDSPTAVTGATISLVLPTGARPETTRIIRDGTELVITRGTRWNYPTATVTLDLPHGETVLTVLR